MNRFGRSSLLFLALSAASVGGSFYLTNLSQENNIINSKTRSNATRNTSDNVYLNITNIMFQEDLKIKVKYTIQSNHGEVVDANFISSTMYGTELVIMNKGETDFEGPGLVERVAFEASELTPSDTSDTSGTATSEPIQLNNGLYEPGKEYDAYVLWHEFDADGQLVSDVWYNTTPSTFTTPVSSFPNYTLKTEYEGANQSLISFNVDYDDSLKDVVAPYDATYFFSLLFVDWENDSNSGSLPLTELLHDSVTNYQNTWIDWDQDDTSFSYYILIDNLSEVEHEFTYRFAYNQNNFGTGQSVDNLDSPLLVNAGNKYLNLPKINYSFEVPEDPTTLADYQKVDLYFSVSENEAWKDIYNTIMTALGYDTNYLELKPINSMEDIVVDNIVSESGETIESTGYSTGQINNYNEDLDPITIKGLNPGTTYTADATLNLNSDIFNKDSLVLPIEFTTLSSVNQPTVAYIGDEDLDGTDFTNWSRDVLKFSLTPGAWSFSPDLIEASEIFKSGNIKFYNKGTLESEATISETQLSKLVEGENSLDTTTLGINLKAGTDYTFTLDLEYTPKAQGLFDIEQHPTVNGSFSTKEQIITPTLRFSGTDLVPDDKSAVDLRFEIVDDTNEFSGAEGEPLTLASTFDRLEIISFEEVSDDGDSIEANDIDYSDFVDSKELVTEAEGENTIRVSGLKGDSTYEFTASLVFDETANNEDPDGWVPFDEDGQILITKRFSTDEKFQPFDVEVNEVSTTKDDGKPTWTSVIEVRVPAGDEATSGLYSPNADVNISYEMFDYSSNEVTARDTISSTDWVEDSINNEYFCEIEFKNLSPSNTYRFNTISTFNDHVMVGVNDGSLVIETGKNNGFTNDMLTAEWGIRDQNKVEEMNVYSDIYVSVSADSINASNQEFLDGYESIQLIGPTGAIIDTNSDLILTTDQKPMLWIPDSFEPKTTLSGYKIKIINNDNTIDSGTELSLPDLVLPGLLEPVTNVKALNTYSTSVDATVNFDNFNNVKYADFEIKDNATGDVLWNYTEPADTFILDESGSKDIRINLEEGTLESEKEYTLTVNTYYKDVVESVDTNSTITEVFTTTPKTYITPSFEVSSNETGVKVDYSWSENTSDKNRLQKITAKILSPKDNYKPDATVEQSIDINEVSGNGSFEFLNLYSGIEYKVQLDSYYGESVDPVTYEVYIETKQKQNSFNSSFDIEQKSESSIEVSYRYEGLAKTETETHSAVSSIKFALYSGTDAIGTPLMEYDVDLSSLDSSGSKTILIDDPDVIIPLNEYAFEEEVTYTSFSGWTSNDGMGDPIYDSQSKVKSIKILYGASEVNTSINFIDSNNLSMRIEVDNYEEFESGNQINLSLVSSGKVLPFVIDGATRELDNAFVGDDNLIEYLNSTESTADKKVYEMELNGIYVPEGETVNLVASYNGVDCSSSATQVSSPLIDPDSIKALSRVDYTSSYYVYELYVETNDSIDLEEDISFTSVNSTMIQLSEVSTIGENLIGDLFEYNENNLYIKVDKDIVKSGDWRDLSFMLGRYIVVNKNSSKSIIDFQNESAFLITGFDMIPIPKEPLTLKQVILVILLVILIFILLWIILYKVVRNHRKEKWYEYALKKANAYYYMHRKNMNMYGWSHKFNEYESLNNLSIPELKEYAKKMHLPIPYGLSKKELVDTLSLLNDAELERIKEYSNYQISIPERVRDELIDEFQTDRKESKWMKKRFQYTIDRAQRMQEEDYKKSLTDHFVDSYIIFDKVFVSLTDKILVLFKLKKVEVKKVEVKEHEWDEHKDSDNIEEGTVVEVETEEVSKGGDVND